MTAQRLIAIAALAAGALSLSTAVWSQPPADGPAASAPAAGRGAGRGGGGRGGAAALEANGAVIATKFGPVKGALAPDGVEKFLGIPYAKPPVEDLRWTPPQDPAPWTAVRNANAAGNSCAEGGSEDCLYINVTRPANAPANAKLPVMYWIHGGGYTSGSGYGGTPGDAFAKKGVIMVSVNYRLGRAGFFAHPGLPREANGNFGFMDQVHGLKWVRDNIARFGGDPSNVTIFGESAGGSAVLWLISMPQAKGLFHKVISESGFARAVPAPLAALEGWSVEQAKANNIAGTPKEQLAALRKLPMSTFGRGRACNPDPLRAYPILDGVWLQQGIAEGFAVGKQAKVPLMTGGNSNEASCFRPQAADLDARPNKEAIVKTFDPQGTAGPARVINDLVTVEKITEPDRNMARLHAKAGVPTYVYYFSYVANPSSMGAAHFAEVAFVHGTTTGAGAPLSDAMTTAWANFAKTGNPGTVNGVAWPKYDAASDQRLEFGNGGVKVISNLQKPWLDFVEAGYKK